MATTLPPRYGSSAEESSPKPSETDEKPKKNEKKRKTTRKKGTDDDHVPLGPGTRDDDDDEGSDDLVGLDNLLQLGEDGGPKKKTCFEVQHWWFQEAPIYVQAKQEEGPFLDVKGYIM